MATYDESTPIDLDDKMETSSGSDSDVENPVESLVAGRSKRATAGNRMSAMIGEIAEDDDLELLFAEDEEAGPDEEFEEDAEEHGSDNDLGDSSDDEDQGPTTGADDLDGEKEIEKQAKEERKRKRKAQRAFTKPSKRLKHAPFMTSASTPTVPVVKAKKKVDRQTWVPNLGEGTRTSRRETTTLQSEALRTRIVEREKGRKEQMKRLEEKARRREANKPKALTQSDRLKEAAEVEKENSKSLNRWEALERERQEEQRARLEALQNRKLQGPVITYWSGPARWVGEKLTAVGNEKVKSALTSSIPDLTPTKPKTDGENETSDSIGKGKEEREITQSVEHGEGSDEKSKEKQKPQASPSVDITIRPKSSESIKQIKLTELPRIAATSPSPSTEKSLQEPPCSEAPSASPQPNLQPVIQEPTRSEGNSASPQPSVQPPSPSMATSTSPQSTPQPHLTGSEGSHIHASQTPIPESSKATPDPSSAVPKISELLDTGFIKQEDHVSGLIPQATTIQPSGAQQIVFSIAPPSSSTQSVSSSILGSQPKSLEPSQLTASADKAKPSPKPVIGTRNLISLMNVDLNSLSLSAIPKELQGTVLVTSSKPVKTSRRNAKPPPPLVCAVTGMPVKYKDPRTGLGYANPYAFKQLRSVLDGRLGWNELTGTYVGAPTRAADGVPEGFLKGQV